ncbi:energy transducer TonB family protein [Hymenobacter yonginensis]|uniref:Energy transducer TonB n=1 Tax=Hymenobacter yonginensis TaxID=748197 RepID=A0ABY7PMB0_9BACT|nr:energy transducer TonB [Hymenobacter yonginensis]WBO83879.1 energy transducer TonB [Hymenobacter yonginensis]
MKLLLFLTLSALLASRTQAQSPRPFGPPDDPLWHCFACKYPEYLDGGFEGMLRAIGQNVRFPQQLQQLQQDGRVFVQFTVSEQGQVRNAVVAQSFRPDADSAAVQAVRRLGAFRPALDAQGRPIAVKLTAPIHFSRK